MEDNRDNYISHFGNAFKETFSDMAGLTCLISDAQMQPAVITSAGLAVIVGMTGARPGRIVLDVSQETAQKIAEVINDEDYGINDEFIIYTIAEMTNILSGRAITAINNMDKSLKLRLTPPSVFWGDKLFITSPKLQAEVINILTPDGEIRVSVGLEGRM